MSYPVPRLVSHSVSHPVSHAVSYPFAGYESTMRVAVAHGHICIWLIGLSPMHLAIYSKSIAASSFGAWYGIVWHGMLVYVYHGLVWSGLVLSGLVWSGLVWSGLVWSGPVGHVLVPSCTLWYCMVLWITYHASWIMMYHVSCTTCNVSCIMHNVSSLSLSLSLYIYLSLSMYMYIYIYVCMYVCIYIYIYIYTHDVHI